MLDKLKSLRYAFATQSRSRKIAIFAILLILAVIPVNIFVAQRQQQTQQRASGANAKITFDPPQWLLGKGQTGNTELMLNPGSHKVSFVKIHLTFDPQYITNIQFAPNTASFPADFGPTNIGTATATTTVTATTTATQPPATATATATPIRCDNSKLNFVACPAGFTCETSGICVVGKQTNINTSTGSNVLGVSVSGGDAIITLGVGANTANVVTQPTSIGTLTFTTSSTFSQAVDTQIHLDSATTQVLAIDTANAGDNVFDPTAAPLAIHLDPSVVGLGISIALNDVTLNAQSPARPVSVKIYENTTGKLISEKTGILTISWPQDDQATASSATLYKGTIDINDVIAGTYVFKIMVPGFSVRKTAIQNGTLNAFPIPGTTQLPLVTLNGGNINMDNHYDINDYQIISSCIDSEHDMSNPAGKYNSAACKSYKDAGGNELRANTDVNKDGKIDGIDYNIFVRSLLNSNGDDSSDDGHGGNPSGTPTASPTPPPLQICCTGVCVNTGGQITGDSQQDVFCAKGSGVCPVKQGVTCKSGTQLK